MLPFILFADPLFISQLEHEAGGGGVEKAAQREGILFFFFFLNHDAYIHSYEKRGDNGIETLLAANVVTKCDRG